MASNNDIVSRVLNVLNSIDKDGRISKRFVLNTARRRAEFYISQKMGERSLQKDSNIYSTINCFEMEQIDVVKCDIIEFRKCKAISKSVHKLPKLIYSRLGSSLKEVTSLDGENEFKATTPSQYRRDKNRGESDYIYFYVKNDYLYILDAEIQMVDLYLITTETEKINEVSNCGDKECCKSLWEYDFIAPDKLEEQIISDTIKEVAMKKQIPSDSNPNLDPNS